MKKADANAFFELFDRMADCGGGNAALNGRLSEASVSGYPEKRR
jgi:hypothetical protein